MPFAMHSHDLSAYNTLALPATALKVVHYRDPAQLPGLTESAAAHSKVFVLGGGSNVVLARSLKNFVIKVESRGVAVVDETASHVLVEAQAGESWHDFVSMCVDQGWDGLENLALIPGTAGAAPVQNIGAYGVELDQRFHSLQAWDLHHGRLVEFGPADCAFSYRNSFFKQSAPGRWLITSVRFALPRPWRPVLTYPDLQRCPVLQKRGAAITAADVFQAVCRIRQAKLPDPATLPNAGSFFKNPVVSSETHAAIQEKWPDMPAYTQGDGRWKLAAGWLIEQVGWKGKRLGPVGMHERQALVLVNHGGATAEDVVHLADTVRKDVKALFGLDLEQEPITVA